MSLSVIKVNEIQLNQDMKLFSFFDVIYNQGKCLSVGIGFQ